jgi:hypothetical protein
MIVLSDEGVFSDAAEIEALFPPTFVTVFRVLPELFVETEEALVRRGAPSFD